MISTSDIMAVMQSYSANVRQGISERWEKLPVEIYDSETYETIGGLLARQATLSIELAMSPSIWTGHMAPLVLRCMTDCHITLAWILIDPNERAKNYILYGLGQQKLYIEHLKAEADQDDEHAQAAIELAQSWLNSQRIDYMTEVNVGIGRDLIRVKWRRSPIARDFTNLPTLRLAGLLITCGSISAFIILRNVATRFIITTKFRP